MVGRFEKDCERYFGVFASWGAPLLAEQGILTLNVQDT
jgi:hypothetical protein